MKQKTHENKKFKVLIQQTCSEKSEEKKRVPNKEVPSKTEAELAGSYAATFSSQLSQHLLPA